MQQIGFCIAKLIVRSTCFGHHYAHHQELKSYTDGCRLWYLALWFTGRWSGVELWVVSGLRDAAASRKPDTTHSRTPDRQLESKAPNTTGNKHLYNTLQLLMMGIIVPETC